MAATFEQLHYRFRKDNGSETGAEWFAAEDTAATVIYPDKVYRLRVKIQAANTAAYSTKTFVLRYSLDNSTYAAIAVGLPVEPADTAGGFAMGDDTTEQLTAGTGTFVANNNGMVTGSATATSMGGDADTPFELEYCFKLRTYGDDGVRQGTVVYFKVYDSTTALDTYTVTPSLTVRAPGGRGGR